MELSGSGLVQQFGIQNERRCILFCFMRQFDSKLQHRAINSFKQEDFASCLDNCMSDSYFVLRQLPARRIGHIDPGSLEQVDLCFNQFKCNYV